ncbi:ABC transporter substrate-binding protein [Aureimonas populi]|uniref:ABC transporter substrate-binding protein n=1 Tax=Aureimonas populi TaxID=1701758 RepID=A0ABW5CH58_9HYPH|nr:ABC transporter substrate-binding protein [Aureimonas populi]
MKRRSFLGMLAGTPLAFGGAVPARARGLRVASLDYALAQTLIALGVTPVGITDARDWNLWVVEPPLPAETVDLGASVSPNLELLAALEPDLVLTTDYTAMSEPQVGRIAPVERFSLFSEGGSPLPKAMEAMTRIGALVGREREARLYLEETEAVFAECAARAAPFRERPLLLMSFLDPRHVRVYARPGLHQDVLDRLGLRNAWQGGANVWGFASVGIERLAEAGEALAIADHLPPDVRVVLEASPLWRSLPLRRDRGPIPVLPPVLSFGGVPAARRLAGLLVETLEGQAA